MKNKLLKIFAVSIITLTSFCFIDKAKAEVVQEWEHIHSGNISCTNEVCSYAITTVEAGAILCFSTNGAYWNSARMDLYIDGNVESSSQFENLGNDFSGGSQSWGAYVRYDVLPGDHYIRMYPASGSSLYRWQFKCFLDNEIISLDTSSEDMSVSQSNSFNRTDTISNTSGKEVFSLVRTMNGNLTVAESDITLSPSQNALVSSSVNRWSEQAWQKMKVYYYKSSSDSISQEFDYNPQSHSTDWATVRNFVFNLGAGDFCGDTICQTTSENCSTCPMDCGECASSPNTNNSSLFFFSNPYTFSNQSTAIVRYLYNEDVFTHYDHVEIRKVSPDWSTSTFVATSTIIDIEGPFNSKRDGKSYFTITGDGTTVGYEYYEVIGHLAPYWHVVYGDVEATTTIPYMLVINWQPTQLPDVSDILSASSSNPFYDDNAMYYAACSEEDWNTPPPEIFGIDVPALNLTVIGCKFKLGFIIAGNKFTTLATDGIYKAGNILKNVFPFNIYTNLNDSWKASASKDVMSELAFLSPVNGNLTAQIPTTGTSTATIVLWGKDIFTSSSTLGTINAQKTNQLFLAIKTIIKWALWGLFGLWAIKNGKAFIDKMTGGQ